jgi:hypothetical protein
MEPMLPFLVDERIRQLRREAALIRSVRQLRRHPLRRAGSRS